MRSGWRVGLAAGGAVALYVVAVLTVPGQRVDARAFGWVQLLAPGPLGEAVPFAGRRVLPVLLAVLVALLALEASRRRHAALLRAVAVVAVPTLVAAVAKGVLPRPDHGPYGYAVNTYPSTHVTVTVGLVAALWLLVRRRPTWLRWAAGGAVVLSVLGNVVGHAHLPSDALGGVLLVVATVGAVSPPRSTPARARAGSVPR